CVTSSPLPLLPLLPLCPAKLSRVALPPSLTLPPLRLSKSLSHSPSARPSASSCRSPCLAAWWLWPSRRMTTTRTMRPKRT
ncbi:MAG: hypothetical protein AVDCRST_MAG15-569, partial [uncultured Rubellimicrobium sp.]